MKEKINNKYVYWGITAFCVLAAIVFFFFCLYRWVRVKSYVVEAVSIFMPFIYGLAIAYIMNPMVNFFDLKIFRKIFKNSKSEKTSRYLSLTAASIVFIGIIVALFSLLIPTMIKSIDTLASSIGTYLNDTKNMFLSFSSSERYAQVVESFYANISSTVVGWFSTDNLENLFLIVRDSVFTTLKTIYNLLIGFVISIYILYDKEKFKGQIKKILYALFKEETVNNILENTRNTDRVFTDFFNAKLIDSLIVGIICFVFMIIFKMPYATMISVIIGVTNIIPYFGPFIGAIPAGLIILLADPTKCIWFLLFIILLQQFDGSILGPKILGSKTGLSSFWVLFSLLVFGSLFGVVGMIIGVPIFSIFYSFVDGKLKKKLEAKKLPVDSKDYIEVTSIRKTKNNRVKINT